MTDQTPETSGTDAERQTDPTEDVSSTDTPEDGATSSKGTDDTDENADSKAGKEAARYRVRLRETEAERDQLRSLVETYQRADAERAVSDVLHRPAGLWAAGTNLADLLDDQGRVDPAKAVAAAKTALEQVGLEPFKRRTPAPDPSQGRGNGGSRAKTWGDVIRKA